LTILGFISTELLKSEEPAILLPLFREDPNKSLNLLFPVLASKSLPSTNIYPNYRSSILFKVPFLLSFPRESRKKAALPTVVEVDSSMTSMMSCASLLEEILLTS
jgi:hypothetical protein